MDDMYMDKKTERSMHYLVLATQVAKQRQLANVLSARFPHERGKIFIPEREFWIRKSKTIGVKPMFPGYLFAFTDMNPTELHLFARENGAGIQTYVNDLAVKEGRFDKADDETDRGADSDSRLWMELTEAETEFMDKMLDEDGIERMSVGYCENGRCIIVEGPLKGWEKYVADSDRHNREAYLNISFRRKRIVVGLELKPKGAFFPHGKNTLAVLEDGTEIDLEELSKKMMRGSIGD